MIQSVSDKVYNYILEKLNDIDNDVHFAGNYGFKFHQNTGGYQTFSFMQFEPDKVDPKEVVFVPFVDRASVEIPFNEQNKRSDMEVEYWFAFKIEEKKDIYNNTVLDLNTKSKEYQALMQLYTNLKNQTTYTTSDMKLAFKAREPQPVDSFRADGDFYKIVSWTLTISKIEKGMFGNETKLYMGLSNTFEENDNSMLDYIEFTSIMGKAEQNISGYEDKESYFDIEKRTWEFDATINYDEEKPIVEDIYKESMAVGASNNVKYKIKIKRNNVFEVERVVIITKANTTHINNVPVTVSFSAKLAEV